VKAFDEAASVARGTGAQYGQALLVPMPVKTSGGRELTPSLLAFLLGARTIIIWSLMASNQRICVQKMVSLLIVSINSFCSGIWLKINIKGVCKCGKILKS
jgi:hypothetical protein